MADVIITGASRGIGRALAVEIAARGDRLLLSARDSERLATSKDQVERAGGRAVAVRGDLGSLADATALGRRLTEIAEPGATLIHNAGVWPSKRVLAVGGVETAFMVNHLGGLALQKPLLEAGALRRIMVVSAGLIVKGRFDAARTPTGEDFSSIRTYCTTKLCFALAMRDVAAAHPEIDVVVLHPGVVHTDLGARSDVVGFLLSLVKRTWESPEICAKRLARILARDRWSPPGEAKWVVEETEQPWPDVADDAALRQAVRLATARYAA